MGLMMILLGGTLGFIGAVTGWLFGGLPFVAALLIWALSGPVTALLVIRFTAARRKAAPAADSPRPQLA